LKETKLTLDTTAELTGFAALGINGPLLKATQLAGFDQPKPIQVAAIPPHLAGRDVLGVAQTGSGKTAAFSLPILTKIIALGTKRAPRTARALILAPTRELAVQIEDTIRVLTKGLHVSTCLVLGGVSRSSQVRKMQPGVDVLIATPGRLMDLIREGEVSLADTKWLVLDEADRMLDMGFINDVRKIAKATHRDRQTALFSATMPDEIEQLARGIMKNPELVAVAPQGTTAAEIKQGVVMARTKQKRQVLSNMLADPAMSSVIVFSRTKHGADRVVRDLERDGFNAPSSTATSRRTPAKRRLAASATVRCAFSSPPTLRRAASTFPASAMSSTSTSPTRPRATSTASAARAATAPMASRSRCAIRAKPPSCVRSSASSA